VKASDTTAVLPPLYAGWIDTLLRSPIPPETHATCEDCAMCAPEGAPLSGKTLYFSPLVKCCTYQPRLPNYLAGRALEDEDFAFSAGRATLEQRIDRGLGVTPLGIDQTATFGLIYQHGQEAFGRAESMRCPHYLEEGGGRCGIWRHRNSVCATWFCKHERGAVGMTFWHRLRDLLTAVEVSLASWCVTESDLDADALASLFPERSRSGAMTSLSAADVDGRPDEAMARRVWGRWLGRERDFYRECALRVGRLGWEDVLRIGGPEVVVRSRLARQAHQALRSEELPGRLTAGSFHILSTGRENVRVVSYTGTDPLDLAPEILEILPYFDGRPVSQAVRAIEEERGVRVEEDLIRKLADFEILLPEQSPGDHR
jgi:hypothetical protein